MRVTACGAARPAARRREWPALDAVCAGDTGVPSLLGRCRMRSPGGPGLGGLLDGLNGRGLGRQVDSWVAPGKNHPVASHELENAFEPAELDEAARHAGADRGTLLNELSGMLHGMRDCFMFGGWNGQAIKARPLVTEPTRLGYVRNLRMLQRQRRAAIRRQAPTKA